MEALLPSVLWDKWVEEALKSLDSLKVLRSLRPISLRNKKLHSFGIDDDDAFEVFDKMQQWDRSSVEVEIGETTFRKWMLDTPSSGKLIHFYYLFFSSFFESW